MPDPRDASSPLLIRERRRVRALESPVRQEIVDAVASGGAAAIAQIASWIGRRPDTLYYHIAALVRVGLLIETGRQRAGKRFGAVYDVPGRPVLIRLGGEVRGEDVARVVRSTLRLADRDMRRAISHGVGRMDGPGRNLWGGRVRGWVRESDLKRLGELIAELGALLRDIPAPSGEDDLTRLPYSFTYVASPIAPRRIGKGKSAPLGRKGAKR